MTLFFNLILLVIFLGYLYYLIKTEWKLFFLYGLLVFQAITILPSLIFIEEGIYISEQGRDSFFVGATFYYLLYFIISFIFLKITFNSLKKYSITAPKFKIGKRYIEIDLILIIAIISMFVLIVNATQSKLPVFDTSVTRFTYWKNSQYPFLNKIFGNVSIFVPFCLGIAFRKYRKTAIFLMIVYFGYNFLIGQKFSPLVSGFFAFILPNILSHDLKKINLKSLLNKKVLLAVLIIFGSSYFVIYKRYEKTPLYAYIGITDPHEAIVYRAFGLQGHLFWGAVERFVNNSDAHTYDLRDTEYGMHELMYQFMPNKELLNQAKEKGASYTNGYPTILLLIFPVWLALLTHIFFTITILSFTGWLLSQFINKQAYLLSLITFQLFNWIIYAFTMGYFYKLKVPLLFVIGYLFLNFFFVRSKRDNFTFS